MTRQIINILIRSETREEVLNCINSGININTVDYCGRNALFYCNQLDAVKAMIEEGIELNHIDSYGNNALFCNTNPDILELLIHSGINIQHKNNQGQSCLHQQRYNIKCAEILINSGANIHSIDNEGQTVLYHHYRPHDFDYWIEKGCNINHTDHNGISVLDLSVDNGKWHYQSNASALIRHIDKINSTPVLIRHINYNSLDLIKLLKQNSVKFLLSEHCTVELYVKDMKSIFNELKQHIEIKHTQFYNCRKKHIGIYTGIERVKWFIRNGIRMDDDILKQRTDSDKIFSYIAEREKKELLKEMKPEIHHAPVRKRL
ncbi:ankyrin repeat domain-containing protein [Salmonella enterica subsp. enterica serovar Lomalinda]|nr:ankyrin repeat domain-containing protein [Salmonella enterica subsp. enterica serovar Lomalinda]ECI5319787.1 ankyrin repeat domain-containing protein [Salmonella enterica subsp. enterica serovar Lomalinda]